MAEKISHTGPDPRIIYADIISLPHHRSSVRPHMSLYNRAAQFAPFAALSGYDDMVKEEARIVEKQIELSETEIERLNRKLRLISDRIHGGEHPDVSVTYFAPDPLKTGGKYVTAAGRVQKVDTLSHTIILEQAGQDAEPYREISIAGILEIRSRLTDPLDDM